MGPGFTQSARSPGLPVAGASSFVVVALYRVMAHGSSISRYQLDIEVKDRDIVVGVPSVRFSAVYYKAAGQPHLILRQRSKCDDYELIADAWKAANDKARELGWIV
jgi:hypothetical protein